MIKMNTSHGFSLLELSIVLVIIGLLAGGVMVGQDLVKQAELRSIINDLSKVQTAVNAFKNKYNSMPGDMQNATAYWGTAATCPATSVAPLVGVATCNGNGSGVISSGEINVTSPEWWLFWHHLANAGLFEGTYTGASVSASTQARPGTNVPEIARAGVGITAVSYLNQPTNQATWWFGDYRLMLVVGREQNNFATAVPAFTPAEMMNIEQKLDDGQPGTGIIRAVKHVNCYDGGVTATSSQTAARLNLTQTTESCTLTMNIVGNPGVGN